MQSPTVGVVAGVAGRHSERGWPQPRRAPLGVVGSAGRAALGTWSWRPRPAACASGRPAGRVLEYLTLPLTPWVPACAPALPRPAGTTVSPAASAAAAALTQRRRRRARPLKL